MKRPPTFFNVSSGSSIADPVLKALDGGHMVVEVGHVALGGNHEREDEDAETKGACGGVVGF